MASATCNLLKCQLATRHFLRLGLWRHPREADRSVNVLFNHEQRRFLDLQEYQSKQILHEHGLRVQKFKVVSSKGQVDQVIYPEDYDGLTGEKDNPQSAQIDSRWSGFKEDISQAEELVIKAQVLAGGRGRGKFMKRGSMSGVQITTSQHDAAECAKSMLNDYLVTKQTGEKGVLVEKVMIAEAVRLNKEFYLAIVLDRSYDKGPIIVTSSAGGMDIEELATQENSPVMRFTIPIDTELDLDTARRMCLIAFKLNMADMDIVDQCADQMIKLHKLLLELDATQIEINPLGVTNKREVICVDSKIKFDENARFRQKWLDELEELNKGETDKRDFEARKSNLSFIGLDGSIGCLVNGAGLAMATMDIIKLHGGEPANFLDVGGGATVDQVKAAFAIIKSDEKVRSIFVNIFGGIMRCDTVAKGIIEASKSLDLKLPIVVRLEGTNVSEAKQLIESSGQENLISCDNFDEAARRVVELSEKR